MRVLLLHNHYGSSAPSGENRVFHLEKAMLEQNGFDVVVFERHSDVLRAQGAAGKLLGAFITPWNPATARQIRALVRDLAPDVVHAHNTFPMISPSVFPAARAAARVLTLHNYRLLCPAAIPMRDGQVCTTCIEQRDVRPALRHRCYRQSLAATVPLAANVALQRRLGTWQKDVEAFIALSDFQRQLMAKGGLPYDKIHVKPNFYPGSPSPIPFADRADRAVFVGRLSAEKGVDDLVTAWLEWGSAAPDLHIVGDGPLLGALQDRTRTAANIHILGALDSQEAEAQIASSKLLILPSRWFEGFPMVLREAFAFGTPVAVSSIGPLPAIAAQAEGLMFSVGDVQELRDKVAELWRTPRRLEAMALASRKTFEGLYSEAKNYECLMEIYAQAIAAKAGRRDD